MTVRDVIARYGTALAGLPLFALFAASARRFLDPTNLLNVLKHASVLALFALGVTLALVTAGLDADGLAHMVMTGKNAQGVLQSG